MPPVYEADNAALLRIIPYKDCYLLSILLAIMLIYIKSNNFEGLELNISDFTDYRDYLKAYISALPKQGRGFSAQLAKAISVSPVIISQVLGGTRSFSMEQALATTRELGLSSIEEEYFLEMVQVDRAGSKQLEDYHLTKLNKLREQLSEIRSRVSQKKELDDKAKAFYYANWYMVAIRLLVNNQNFSSPESISKKLQLPLDKVNTALMFLQEHDLIEKTSEAYSWKGTSTHIPSDSPLVNRHHQNWRIQAIKRMEQGKPKESEVFFTAPSIIDKDTAIKIRKMILNLIEESQSVSGAAPSEEIFCMNLDLFMVGEDISD